MSSPIFITGNQNKADHLANLLGIRLEHQKVDLEEIQSIDLDEIVTHKAKQAFDLIQKPVLVEDISLGFAALDGLPGPFIKFFEQGPGLEKMCRMLDAFDDRSAIGECVFGYYDGTRLKLIHGRIEGRIAQHPRGGGGFGWDQIFEPIGYDGKTRAELTPEQYAEVYAKIRLFTELRVFLRGEA